MRKAVLSNPYEEADRSVFIPQEKRIEYLLELIRLAKRFKTGRKAQSKAMREYVLRRK
jgi:hypothetical protein